MRVIVFFDLPTITGENRRNYRRFRKFLISEGFVMMQESVYSKLTLNQTGANTIMENVARYKPPAGLIQMLSITEKQYNNLKIVSGKSLSQILDSDKKLIVL